MLDLDAAWGKRVPQTDERCAIVDLFQSSGTEVTRGVLRG